MSKVPSAARRIVQVSCAVVWCLFAAGPMFGFAALKPILISQGIYRDRCDAHIKTLTTVECTDQDLALNLLFTVACMVTNISALPVGSILDNYGPRVSGIIGSFILALGAFCLKYSDVISWFDPYIVGCGLLALGGPFVFISSFQLANSFPRRSGLILALLTGAFDSSSALFLGYRILYTRVGNVPLTKFFFVYLLVPLFIVCCQVFLMPHDSYKTMGDLAEIAELGPNEDELDTDTENTDSYFPENSPSAPNLLGETSALLRLSLLGRDRRSSLASVKSASQLIAQDKHIAIDGGVFGVLHGYSVSEQMRTGWFLIMAVLTTIQMLRINYFLTTIKSQMLFLFQDEQVATQINHFFDMALPLGGVVAIPFIGLVLDNMSTLLIVLLIVLLSFIMGVCGMLTSVPGQYFGIMVLVVYRPFFYTAVSDYAAKVFGYDTFGTVYGTIMSISGICNIFSQVMVKMTHDKFDLDPRPINAFLLISGTVAGLSMFAYIKLKEKVTKRRQLELEAQTAIAVLVPQ